MVAAAKTSGRVEYPTTDDMGEHLLQRVIANLLRSLVRQWLAGSRRVATVGANQFVYWVEGDPRRCRAPDVYVVEGVSLSPERVGVWKTWEGHAPSFAFEVVSDDQLKDYEAAPRDYDAMGVRELVVFDPWATVRSRKRVRWQVFRRTEGVFTRVESASGDRVWSEVLGCWLRSVDGARGVRVRLATGSHGDTLIATASAHARLLRQIAETQADAERRARQEAEEHARDAEARTRDAENEIVRLRAELARLRGG